MHAISRYGTNHDWRRLIRYPCELPTPDAWGNLIAFKQPVDEGRLARIVSSSLAQHAANAGDGDSLPQGGVQEARPVEEIHRELARNDFFVVREEGDSLPEPAAPPSIEYTHEGNYSAEDAMFEDDTTTVVRHNGGAYRLVESAHSLSVSLPVHRDETKLLVISGPVGFPRSAPSGLEVTIDREPATDHLISHTDPNVAVAVLPPRADTHVLEPTRIRDSFALYGFVCLVTSRVLSMRH